MLMQKNSPLQTLNLVTIFLMVMWKPFGAFVLQMTGHTTIIAGIALVVLVLNILVNMGEITKTLSSTPMVVWTLLTVYAVGNSLVKGYEGGGYAVGGQAAFYIARFMLPYIFLLLSLLELGRDKKKAWRALYHGTFVFTLITVLLTSIGGETRFDADSSEIGNDLAITGAVFLLLAMVRYLKSGLKLIYPVAAGIYVLIISLLTQTRTALGAIAIMMVGFVLSLSSKRGTRGRSVLLVLIMAAGLYVVVDRVALSSAEGVVERMQRDEYRDLQLVENEGANKFLLQLLGSRAIHYVLGFEVVGHGDYPVTGIGVGNFMEVAQWRNALHSEYLVQLVENGIIGIVLLVILYYSIIKGLVKDKRQRWWGNIFLWGIFALMFMNIVAWSYEKYWGMIIYALAINEITSRADEESEKKLSVHTNNTTT